MRRWLVGSGVAATGCALAFACASTEPAANAVDAGDAAMDSVSAPDAEAEAEVDAASPAACAPHAFSGPTRYVPPRPWHQAACSPAAVEAFVSACAHGDAAACDAFAKREPTCFACAVTPESERTWGAFVVFEGGYLDPNVTGCIANALGDLSDDGCGAARGRLRHCGERACRGCFPVSDAKAYEAFEACVARDDAAKICADDLAGYRAKCAGHVDPRPDDPTYPCLGVGLTRDALFRDYVTAFCTAEADAATD